MNATIDPISELLTHVRARATELRAVTMSFLEMGDDGSPCIPHQRAVEFDQAVATCLARVARDEPPFEAMARALRFAAALQDAEAADELRVEVVRVIAFGA